MKKYDFECRPVVAWLNVNQACNMRCKWCYAENSHYDTTKQMSINLAKELIDISISMGVNEFVLIGGEPTVWPYLFNTISYIKERGATTSIITNGLRFAEDDFWNQYKEMPATSIGLSVKSATKDIFQNATGIDQYEKSMLGIKRAIKFHRCGVSAVHNSLVGINGTIDIAKKCKDFGATSFQLVMCAPSFKDNGDICTDFTIPPKKIWNELKIIAEQLEKLYAGNVFYDTQLPLCLFPKNFVLDKLEKKRIQTQCHIFSRSGINFSVNGDVILCNTIPEIVAIKNIDFVDATTLKSHLDSVECRSEYRQLSRYPSPKCDICIYKDDCRGGCLMNWLTYDASDICQAVQ